MTGSARTLSRLSLLFALALLLPALAGCAVGKPADTTAANPETSAEITELPSVTDTAAVSETAAETEPAEIPVGYFNPITGEKTETDLTLRRPVAISVDNVLGAQPSVGISLSDCLVELPFEGFETRLLAVVLDYESLPTFGNIRSARDYMVRYSQDFGAIFVHAGADYDENCRRLAPAAIEHGFAVSYLIKKDIISVPEERQDLWTDGIDDLDAVTKYFPTPMFRDEERLKTKSYEHTLMLNASVLTDAIRYYKFPTEFTEPFSYPFTPLCEGESRAISGAPASYIALPYAPGSESYASVYRYDEKSGLYLRSRYLEPHVDQMTGEQLSFSNVIVLYVDSEIYAGDPKNRLNVDYVGTGSGWYFCGGQGIEITWSRPDPESLMTISEKASGKKLEINPGKVMINIFPASFVPYVTIR
ncbi:MAG: DUF3048 domain-containing protein [Clostridia bacterium]|nr:DUF3048 domain-containing protein [Clostridia bacterium]